MTPKRWLLLIYTVPTTPSRTRAFVWREIRRAGALLVRDGVAALPVAPDTTRWARETGRRIEAAGGTATTAVASLDPNDERRVVAAFRADRDREYSDVVAACQGLITHVARESEHSAFTFDELQELEGDLEKIRGWNATVRGRDRFGAAGARRATRAIAEAERSIAAFAEHAAPEAPGIAEKRRRKRGKVRKS